MSGQVRHEKLVRDLIPAICRRNGAEVEVRVLGDDEWREALFAKLAEETAELREDRTVEEMADVLEVLYTLADAMGWPWAAVESARENKSIERGGFRGGYFLISTTDSGEEAE